MRTWRLLCLVVLMTGCADKKPPTDDTVIPLDQVPATVMSAAKKQLPDVVLDTAYRNADGDYEIRGKTKNGKIREVEVRPSGEVIKTE